MTQHPKIFTLENIKPATDAKPADYLRSMADLIDQHETMGNTHVSFISVEMSSAQDSPAAAVTVRMVLRTNEERSDEHA